uniref:Uncharacterized protein n=1 Tax=Rhizophora mucronata TaxID=61149 RepID=A0A2P2J093_RHIMU
MTEVLRERGASVPMGITGSTFGLLSRPCLADFT